MSTLDQQLQITRLINLRFWARCPHCGKEQHGIVQVGGKLYCTPYLRVMVFVCCNSACEKTVHWGVREPEKREGVK